MNLVIIFLYIISSGIFLFLILPASLFIVYLFSDLYLRVYSNIVGEGQKWYQKMFAIPISLFNLKDRRFIKKHLSNGTSQNYVAIILANNYFPEKYSSFGIYAVITLIKYLKKKDKNYIIYDRITSEKLRKVIRDKNVESLFLFGHGQRHGIKVGKDEIVYYCEFPDNYKKKIIAQFHCNHFKGKSLADYGEKPIYCFIENKIQRQRDLNKQLSDIISRGLI